MSPLSLMINGRLIPPSRAVVEHQGAYYGPLREMFNALGGHSTWLAREGKVVVRWANHLIVVPATGTVISLDGERKVLARQTRLIDDHLYVPLESFAKAFSGTLTEDSEKGTLKLFLPIGRLNHVRVDEDVLHLGWTAEGDVDFDLRGGRLAILLKDTTWPISLRRVCIERQPGGSLEVLVETTGGQLLQAVGERGIRLEWEGRQGGPLAGLTFAIDAGHGGSDQGVVGPAELPEKDITRMLADKLLTRLLAAGADIIDVRPGDQRLSVEERVKAVKKGGASILVSIHLNGREGSASRGTETFHLNGNRLAALLADTVHRVLTKQLKLRNREVKQASFHLLRALPDIPAIVIEVDGEVCHAATASAIFTGLEKYVEEHKSFIVS